MKKVIFILFVSLCGGSMAQAQVLDKLKAKTKTAAESSVDRSADKVVDKAVNKTSDNATDKIIGKAGEKLNSLFKRKKKKKAEQQPAPDTIAKKPGDQIY